MRWWHYTAVLARECDWAPFIDELVAAEGATDPVVKSYSQERQDLVLLKMVRGEIFYFFGQGQFKMMTRIDLILNTKLREWRR